MKFVDINGKQSSYQGIFNEVEYREFPFSNLILKKGFPSLSYVDVESIPLTETEQIKVNINNVGWVLFFFKPESFNKDGFVEAVLPLKEIETNNFADVISKTRSLYEIAAKYKPVFSLYCPRGRLVLIPECIATLVGLVPTFYVNNIPYDEVDNYRERPKLFPSFSKKKQPKKVEQKPVKKKEETVKVKKEKTKFKFKNPFPIISENKFHYLFAFVASFLIGFTISISIFDMYIGKMIYIFFLICSLAGMALNMFVYRDTLNETDDILSMELLINIAISVIGVGVSLGGYYIFVALSNEKPSTNPNILLIIGISVLAVAVSASIAFLIRYIKKKRA